MTPEVRFALASLLTMMLPILIALGSWRLGRPRHALLRALLAIAAAWALSIVMTSEVYNPAGIAAAHARGEHFPENRYDNNTVAVQILSGWFPPLIALLVARFAAL